MISVERAWEIACGHAPSEALSASLEGVQALNSGWFFPWKMTVPIERNENGMPMNVPVGSNGVIVNKDTGVPLLLGSAYSAARDIEFYDLGYQSTHFDLVVLSIADLEATVDALVDIGPRVIDMSYEAGTVWRVPRPLSRVEISERLRELPCIFADLSLYFRFERLQAAELSGHFEFKALGRPQK